MNNVIYILNPHFPLPCFDKNLGKLELHTGYAYIK
jgi:hypothetical protein